ncbi:MAG: LysM domain-containing protein [Planctomycetota bacterium]|nr:MAG: LysM domain-containing protein [Planctomycetota bacterium]
MDDAMPRAEQSAPSSRPASADDAGDTTAEEAGPVRPVARSGVRVYIVRRGDTLTAIARRELGSVRRWREIYELNNDRLESAHHLPIGFELLLPDR